MRRSGDGQTQRSHRGRPRTVSLRALLIVRRLCFDRVVALRKVLLSRGWFEFKNTVLEYAATPLLDVQSDPTLSYSFEGIYSVLIEGFQHQDSCEFANQR